MKQPFVGVSDAALEVYLGERASRLGQQIQYRVQLRRVQDVGTLVEAGVGVAVISETSVPDLAGSGVAVTPARIAGRCGAPVVRAQPAGR